MKPFEIFIDKIQYSNMFFGYKFGIYTVKMNQLGQQGPRGLK